MTTTRIAHSTAEDVFVRGKSLTKDLVGKVTFTEATYLLVMGTVPTPAQTAVLDACLVTLMEHGLTPSVLASRLVYSSAPEALQGAVAAGLLGVGSVFVGTVEGCAELLARIVAAKDAAGEAKRIAEATARVPGFGHPQHKPDDPRPSAIFAVAEAHGVAGAHVAALRTLAAAVDASAGKHITINATGAVAAALLDAGIPPSILRGFALLARCAGLVGHLLEEQRDPSMRAIWSAAERAIPYQGT
ncbi:MAG TPA: citryl-CoA lyase [Labilithrix sp.]|jgi:citrate synthase